MSLTRLRACLSFATPACLPTRPPLLRLRTRRSFLRWRYSLAQSRAELFSELHHTAADFENSRSGKRRRVLGCLRCFGERDFCFIDLWAPRHRPIMLLFNFTSCLPVFRPEFQLSTARAHRCRSQREKDLAQSARISVNYSYTFPRYLSSHASTVRTSIGRCSVTSCGVSSTTWLLSAAGVPSMLNIGVCDSFSGKT